MDDHAGIRGGMDLNPELLSASDRLCVGLVVQCMSQCRVHNLNCPPDPPQQTSHVYGAPFLEGRNMPPVIHAQSQVLSLFCFIL